MPYTLHRVQTSLKRDHVADLTDNEIAEIDKAGKEGEYFAAAGAPQVPIEQTVKEAKEKAEKK